MSELFRKADPWGDEVVFTQADLERIVAKHGEVRHLILGEIQRAVEDPEFVHASSRNRRSKVFYGRHEIREPPWRGGFVAAVIDYRSRPATIRTIYLPRHPKGAIGPRIYERGEL